MVRTNCDYVFLQPIYNKTQRDILWDLEAGFMDRNDFSTLMDQLIVRENLEGNSAREPKKCVQIMVCADFEDSSNPQEKFYTFKPVPMDELPPFRLCHPKYWEDNEKNAKQLFDEPNRKNVMSEIREVQSNLMGKVGAVKVL